MVIVPLAIELVHCTELEDPSEQIVSLSTAFVICGDGLIVIVNCCCTPSHSTVGSESFVKTGSTVTVATIGLLVVLSAIKTGIGPVPVVGVKPILVSTVQLYSVVPSFIAVENVISVVVSPLQKIIFPIGSISAAGFTIIEYSTGAPIQLPAEVVTACAINTNSTGDDPELLSVYAGIVVVPVN